MGEGSLLVLLYRTVALNVRLVVEAISEILRLRADTDVDGRDECVHPKVKPKG